MPMLMLMLKMSQTCIGHCNSQHDEAGGCGCGCFVDNDVVEQSYDDLTQQPQQVLVREEAANSSHHKLSKMQSLKLKSKYCFFLLRYLQCFCCGCCQRRAKCAIPTSLIFDVDTTLFLAILALDNLVRKNRAFTADNIKVEEIPTPTQKTNQEKYTM